MISQAALDEPAAGREPLLAASRQPDAAATGFRDAYLGAIVTLSQRQPRRVGVIGPTTARVRRSAQTA